MVHGVDIIDPPGGPPSESVLHLADRAPSLPCWFIDDDAVIALWLHGRPLQTQRAYRANVERFRSVVCKPLGAVTLADLQGYADTLAAAALAPATQKRLLAVLKSLFAFAHGSGYLPYNVARAIRLPAIRGRLAERIPSEDDVLVLLAAEPNPRNHALIRLLYTAGLRLAEACALCWRDLQPRGAEGQATVWGKGAKERTVLITAGTWQEILALRRPTSGPDDPVFRSRQRRPLSPTQGWRIVKLAALRAGLERAPAISPHWLRHAHASHALDRGAPVSLVRDSLGHASLVTTSRYTHARPGDGSGRYLPL